MKQAMKTNKIIKRLSLALVGFAALATTSCKDEPDAYKIADGKPTVMFIRPVNAASRDSIITSASMQTTVCIVGENLRSVTGLLFNDQAAVLNTSYMTDNTLIVTIPNEIPGSVTDKIYLATNSKDTVTYDFHVVIPAPVVASMTNEWAEAGEEVSIIGDYFLDYADFPVTVNFGDDYTLPRSAIKSITKNRITFTMPEDVPEEQVSVISIYGETKGAFKYRDSRGMLFDFDTPCKTGVVLGNHGWHNRDILADETSLSGNYLLLGGAAMGADGAWNDGNFSFEYWAGSWDTPQNITSGDGIALFNLADFKDSQNKALKFEMYIPSSNPWQAGAMQICFQPLEQVTISGNAIEGYDNVAAANMYVFNGEGTGGDWAKGKWGRGMYRPWTETGKFDTGDKWITVTIPLTSLIYDRTGAVTDTNNTPSKETDFASFTMFVMGGGITGTECSPIIKVDNIRVVPIK